MSGGTAKTVVLLTGGLMLAFVGLQVKNGTSQGSTYKKVWAIGLLTLALSVAADFVPQIVGPFAGLILIAAYARNEGALGGLIGSKTPATSGAAQAHTGQSGIGPSTGTIGGTK